MQVPEGNWRFLADPYPDSMLHASHESNSLVFKNSMKKNHQYLHFPLTMSSSLIYNGLPYMILALCSGHKELAHHSTVHLSQVFFRLTWTIIHEEHPVHESHAKISSPLKKILEIKAPPIP